MGKKILNATKYRLRFGQAQKAIGQFTKIDTFCAEKRENYTGKTFRS